MYCIYMLTFSRILSVLGVPYIRPYGTERKKFFYFQRQSDDSYFCPVCGHKLLSVPIEVDESGCIKDRTLSFQERVELHLADPSVLLPLANNEAERHYVTVRLQEHRDREKEKKEDEKARQANKLQREGFRTIFIGLATLGVTLGGFIFEGLNRL